MLSRCLLDFSFVVWAFVIGPIQISTFFLLIRFYNGLFTLANIESIDFNEMIRNEHFIFLTLSDMLLQHSPQKGEKT